MRIPRVEGTSIEDEKTVYGYLHVLERYNKYYILPCYPILNDGDTIPMIEVHKDSIKIQDVTNASKNFRFKNKRSIKQTIELLDIKELK